MSAYLMESPDEAARLERKTDDAQTREQLRLVGVHEGMTVLDAGAGSGAVARTCAELVGPRGRVVAFDRSEERLAFGRELAGELPQLHFTLGDIYNMDLPSDSFDLTWSRFVFEYLQEPDQALAELVRVTRPGGRVVVADLDGNALFHYPVHPLVQEGLDRLQTQLSHVFDPFAGRKLFHRFHRSGLQAIRVHALPYHLYAGPADEDAMANWTQKFRTIRPYATEAFGNAASYDRFVEGFLSMLRQEDTLTYSILFIVEGTKAA